MLALGCLVRGNDLTDLRVTHLLGEGECGVPLSSSCVYIRPAIKQKLDHIRPANCRLRQQRRSTYQVIFRFDNGSTRQKKRRNRDISVVKWGKPVSVLDRRICLRVKQDLGNITSKVVIEQQRSAGVFALGAVRIYPGRKASLQQAQVTEVVSDGGAREEASEVIAQLARLVAFRF